MHDIADLRSDTLTLPTPAMHQAMTPALDTVGKIHQIGPASIRCVTHKDVDGEDVEQALEGLREITAGW